MPSAEGVSLGNDLTASLMCTSDASFACNIDTLFWFWKCLESLQHCFASFCRAFLFLNKACAGCLESKPAKLRRWDDSILPCRVVSCLVVQWIPREFDVTSQSIHLCWVPVLCVLFVFTEWASNKKVTYSTATSSTSSKRPGVSTITGSLFVLIPKTKYNTNTNTSWTTIRLVWTRKGIPLLQQGYPAERCN